MSKENNSILYVDDEPINLEVFKSLLDDDYDIITTSTTSEAFEILGQKPIKVLVSDQRMPEETGLQFLERVEPIYPDIIKIVFTAYQDQETTLQAINQGGIFRFLIKPCNTKELRLTMQSAILEYDLKTENKRLVKELKIKNEELENALQRVQESEARFRGIFECSSDGIIISDSNSIIEANPAFSQLIGFNCDILDKQQIFPFLKRLYPSFLKSLLNLQDQAPTGMEVLLINTDKKYLEANSQQINLKNQQATLSIIRDITERKTIEKKLRDAIVATQEEDQIRYARELHDGLGPILSALKMYIEWLSDPNNTVNKDKITEQSIKGINEAITIVKEIANNLSPHVLQRFGLVNAVQSYIDGLKRTTNTEFILSSNIVERLDSNIEISLYRIILESINNTIKHANASKVIIRLRKTEEALIVLYSDNGKGFDVDNVIESGKGMGLTNLHNRVKSINGDIKLKSNLNIGTDIEITIPL
jgi:PAS domain S-box-containing protein